MRWTLLLWAGGLVSCAPATLYTPSGALVPMFTKAGQTHVNAQGGPQGAQINVAYAVGGHLMVRMTGHSQNRDDGHYHLISAGAGFFLATSPRRPEIFHGFRFSGGADFGFADVRATATATTPMGRRPFHSGFLYRIALQADAGVDFKYVQLAAVGRLVYLSLKHSDDSAAGPGASADWWVFEPVGVLRFGLESLKLEVQGGYSDPYSQTGFIGEYRKWFGMIGVVWTPE